MDKLDYREAISLEVLFEVYNQTLRKRKDLDLVSLAENEPGIRVKGPNLLITHFNGINLEHLLKPHSFLVMSEEEKVQIVAKQLLKIYKEEGLTINEKLHEFDSLNYDIAIAREAAKIFSSRRVTRTNYETLMVLCWVTSDKLDHKDGNLVFHFEGGHTASFIDGTFSCEHLGVELEVPHLDCWKILEDPKMQGLNLCSPASHMAIMANNKFRYSPRERAVLKNAIAACEGLYNKENLVFRLTNYKRNGIKFIQLCKLAVKIFNSDEPITSAFKKLRFLGINENEFMESFEGLIPYQSQFGVKDRIEFYRGLQYLTTQKGN